MFSPRRGLINYKCLFPVALFIKLRLTFVSSNIRRANRIYAMVFHSPSLSLPFPSSFFLSIYLSRRSLVGQSTRFLPEECQNSVGITKDPAVSSVRCDRFSTILSTIVASDRCRISSREASKPGRITQEQVKEPFQ